jgi:hypothetical protein
LRRCFVLLKKKDRIYAVCGVSQTPITIKSEKEEFIIDKAKKTAKG